MSQRVMVVKLALDSCAEVFGVGACTASGTPICYNTKATCLDTPNFNQTTIDYLFTFAEGPNIKNQSCYRAILAVRQRPGQLDMQQGIGGNSRVEITLEDFPDPDATTDAYYNDRAATYDSTFARKLLQRHTFHVGRTLTLYIGELDADGEIDLTSATSDTYRIEQIKLSGGRWVVVGSDWSPMLDDNLVPAPSTISLATDETDASTSWELQSGEGASVSINDRLAVGDEIVKVTGVAGDVLTVVRDELGSTAEAHSIDDRLQIAFYEEDTLDKVWEAILLAASIPAGRIDSAGAATEAATLYDATVTWLTVAPKAQKARQLMAQLMAQASAYTFFDTRVGKWVLKLLRPPDDVANETLTARANIIGLPDGPIPQEQLRATRVLMYFDVRDWTKDPTKFDRDEPNFGMIGAYINADKEAADEHGVARALEVFAWGLQQADQNEADAIAWRKLNTYSTPPRTLQLSVTEEDWESKSLKTGSLVDITLPELIDTEGQEVSTTFIVTGYTPRNGIVNVSLYELDFDGKWWRWAPDAGQTSGFHAQWADASGLLSDGTEGFKWV